MGIPERFRLAGRGGMVAGFQLSPGRMLDGGGVGEGCLRAEAENGNDREDRPEEVRERGAQGGLEGERAAGTKMRGRRTWGTG